MTVAEIAQNTLDLLERDGWCKHALIWHGSSGPYRAGSRCLAGAAFGTNTDGTDFRLAWVPRADIDRFMVAAWMVASEQFPERGTSWPGDVVSFNNHPATTFEDVRLVLEKVIANG